MKVRLNDYEVKDSIRILRQWTELYRTEFGKSLKKSANTIKNYEIGKSNYKFNSLKN